MDRNVLKDYATRIEDLTTEIVEPISKLVGLSVCLGILDGEANREQIPSPETPRCNSSGNGDTPPVKFDVKEENAKLLYKEVYQYLYENCSSEIANAVRDGLKGRFETLLGIKI
jgi:hypothetical protein